jgi:hypothetical protein
MKYKRQLLFGTLESIILELSLFYGSFETGQEREARDMTAEVQETPGGFWTERRKLNYQKVTSVDH